ncbi:MAG TPA: hypothetical protein VEB21_04105, partial [Terriglobales bacterium]|nr:hypothetical protein [Terriglobales bacterium]
NRRLDQWVVEIVGVRIHGTTGEQPLEVFERVEKGCLRALPAKRFETVTWKRARVHPDSRIEFDRRLYPVPWKLIGKDLWIRATAKTVTAYWDETRVATHERNKPVQPEVYDQYLPEHRSQLRYRSQSFWLERADRIGKEVGVYVREIFAADEVLSQLRTVQMVVTHLETFPPERARAACIRAQYYANYTYPAVRDILRKGIEREPLPVVVVPATITERPRFARSIRDLFTPTLLEECDESH